MIKTNNLSNSVIENGSPATSRGAVPTNESLGAHESHAASMATLPLALIIADQYREIQRRQEQWSQAELLRARFAAD